MPGVHTATPALLTALLKLHVQGQSSTELVPRTLQHRPQNKKQFHLSYRAPTSSQTNEHELLPFSTSQEHLTEESWAQVCPGRALPAAASH